MKSKVFTLRIAIALSVLSLIVSYVIYRYINEYEIFNFIFTIASGIFSGTIVSVFIYIAEYHTEKRVAMENYFILSYELLNRYLKIEYFYKTKEDDVLADYYEYQLLKDNEFYDVTDKYHKVIEFYSLESLPENKVGEILDFKLSKFKKRIDKILDQYLEFESIKYKDIEFAYGSIYYFWGQKPRMRIYNKIHVPQREMLSKVKGKCYDFGLYRNGEANNLKAVLIILEELQTQLFETVRNKESNFDNIYNTYYEKTENELEIFRAKIYGKEPEVVEKCLVKSVMVNAE